MSSVLIPYDHPLFRQALAMAAGAVRPDAPILMVSSAAGHGAALNAVRFGAVGFLGKDADLSAYGRRGGA